MCRWKSKFDSLAFRFAATSFACFLFLVTIFGGLISWSFKEGIDQALVSYLSAKIDLLVAGTNIDHHGKLQLDQRLHILDKEGVFWHIGDHPQITHLKLLEVTTVNGDLVQFEHNATPMIGLMSDITLPNDHRVKYIFGVAKQDATLLTADEVHDFYTYLTIIILVLASSLTLVVLVQLKFSLTPLTTIKYALAKVLSGQTNRIEGNFFSEVRPMVHELNQLLDYSSKLIDSHRSFASNLSHSIKTPLSIISNHSKSELVTEQVKIIESIINRNLARLRMAGGNNLLSHQVDIGQIVTVIGKNYGKLYGKTITMTVLGPYILKGDENDLYEAIGNLIENACKFARAEVVITVQQAKQVQITIEDDGPGIDFANNSIDLFSRGTRLDETVPGTGIGLSIAKEIIDSYHGHILLDNSQLGGLKVVVEL